jgi:hypothetical protein
MSDQSQPFPSRIRPLAASLMIASATLLVACGDSSSGGDEPHEHTDIDTAGRLALFDTDASQASAGR